MRKATITQLKNELSELIEAAKNGEPVLIFDRNTPVVKMISALSSDVPKEADEAHLAKLERSGLVRRGDPKRFIKILKDNPPVVTKSKVDLVQSIIDERNESF